MEYYSGIENMEILPFVTTWMDTEDIMLSKARQGKKYYMISYVES